MVEDYTEDHLPPKGLFPEEDEFRLLKVRACKKCHPKRDLSMDDEYFRNCLEIWMGKDRMPPEVVSRRKRAWKRKPFQELDMLLKTERGFVESGSGVFQPMYMVKIQDRRINSVLERIGKGFHFARWKERVPTIANIYINESSIYSYTAKLDKTLYNVPNGFILIPGKFIVRNWHIRSEKLCASNWVFRFYDNDTSEFFVKFEWFN